MAFSVLNSLLTANPRDAKRIAQAIDAGEVSATMAVQATPDIVANFMSASTTQSGMMERDNLHAGQLAVVERLLNAGADAWAKDFRGVDAFTYAVSCGNAALVRRLAQAPNTPSDLPTRPQKSGPPLVFQAVNHAGVLRELFALGLDPHTAWNGMTLLHAAGNREVVEVLLQHGLDPATITEQGHDVQAHWDKRDMLATERAQMEAALRTHAPQDPSRLLREFGQACVQVGIPAARQRLAAAGVDTQTAEHAGFSLPELMAIEALGQGMKHLTSQSLGNPLAHKKWRKMVLSVARACHVDRWNEGRVQQLQDIVGMMTLVDFHLIQKNKPRVPTVANAHKKKAVEPQDTSMQDLQRAVGLPEQHYAGSPSFDTLGRWTLLIDRMVDAGLVGNGSLLAGWVLQATVSNWRNQGSWMQPIEGEPLFLRLAKQATRGEFDPTWKDRAAQCLRISHQPIADLALPITLPDAIAVQDNGVGVMACLLDRAEKKDHLLRWMNIQLEGHALSNNLTLSLQQDPWLAHGVEALRTGKHKEAAGVGAQLHALAQQQDLDRGTTQPTADRRGPRL